MDSEILWTALTGGALIGSAAVVLMAANGRIAGIAGIVGGLFGAKADDVGWRLALILGLLMGPWLAAPLTGGLPAITVAAPMPIVVVAGLLVGFGARLGSGCTSGHGVCGLARLSPRSLVATTVFMVTGFATVFVVRHLLAG